MSKFIRLYKSKRTPITGDIFTLAAYNYSEDNDIKDNTGKEVEAALDLTDANTVARIKDEMAENVAISLPEIAAKNLDVSL